MLRTLIVPLGLILTMVIGQAALPNVQSIRITNTQADWFYLEELTILNEAGEDVASVAFGSVAEGSEAGFFSPVEGAIDDLIGECCETGWHSSTSNGDQFYIITLPSAQTLSGEITVWDRTDVCCSHRLDSMLFEFFDEPDAMGTLLAGTQIDNLASDSVGDINLPDVGASFPIPPPDDDFDGDGLTNRYEEANGLDPNDGTGDQGAEGDLDKDGSTNLAEFERETDPQVPDTDEDGLIDGAETGTGVWMSSEDTGTDPLNPDTDGDTLLDGVETNTMTLVDAMDTGTSPHVVDSDEDGIRDHRELFFLTDPNDAESVPTIIPSLTGVRSVRLTNVLEDWFYVEELDLFNTGDFDVFSLALGTTVEASEPGGFGAPITGPIDDAKGACCANGYHSSTDAGNQTLTFTFPEPQDLAGDIWIANRIDGCCASRLDGMLFEFFDGENGTGELIASQLIEGLGAERTEELNSPEGAPVPLVIAAPTGPIHMAIAEDVASGNLTLSWNSSPVEYFALEQSTDLSEWMLVEPSLMAAVPPAGAITFEVTERMEPAAFYRVGRVPPPPFLAEDFEGTAEGWVADTSDVLFPNAGETRFELGVPTVGPEAHGGQQVYATNLSGNYDEEVNITLTSPVVDLTRERLATLRFWYTLDVGEAEGAVLEFIDADDPTLVLAATDPFVPAGDWELFEMDLREIEEEGPSVVGQRLRLRFRFLSDGDSGNNGAGFYLDDLRIAR